jgi:hypothetical protein
MERLDAIREYVSIVNADPQFSFPQYAYVLEKDGTLSVVPREAKQDFKIAGRLRYEIEFPTITFRETDLVAQRGALSRAQVFAVGAVSGLALSLIIALVF